MALPPIELRATIDEAALKAGFDRATKIITDFGARMGATLTPAIGKIDKATASTEAGFKKIAAVKFTDPTKSMEALRSKITETAKTVETKLISAFDELGPATAKAVSSSSAGLNKAFNDIRFQLVAIGAAATLGIKGSINAFTDLQDAMANVRKTTGLTAAEIEIMGNRFKELSTTSLPNSARDLGDIAAIAGQLGIEGADEIERFTVAIARASVVFGDLDATAAATGFAQLANVLQITKETGEGTAASTERLINVVNELENSSIATAGQIVDITNRFGTAGKQAGLTSDQILAISATVRDVGRTAEVGGTALGTFFVELQTKSGTFAKALGLNVVQFEELAKKSPIDAFKLLLQRLKESKSSGQDLSETLKDLSIDGARSGGLFLAFADNIEKLDKNLKSASEEMTNNISAQKEFAIQAKNVSNQLARASNAANVAAIDIGSVLAPSVVIAAEKFRDLAKVIRDLPPGFSQLAAGALVLTAVLPIIALAFNQIVIAGGSLVTFGRVILPLFGKMSTALRILGSFATQASAGLAGVVALPAAVAVGVAVLGVEAHLAASGVVEFADSQAQLKADLLNTSAAVNKAQGLYSVLGSQAKALGKDISDLSNEDLENLRTRLGLSSRDFLIMLGTINSNRDAFDRFAKNDMESLVKKMQDLENQTGKVGRGFFGMSDNAATAFGNIFTLTNTAFSKLGDLASKASSVFGQIAQAAAASGLLGPGGLAISAIVRAPRREVITPTSPPRGTGTAGAGSKESQAATSALSKISATLDSFSNQLAESRKRIAAIVPGIAGDLGALIAEFRIKAEKIAQEIAEIDKLTIKAAADPKTTQAQKDELTKQGKILSDKRQELFDQHLVEIRASSSLITDERIKQIGEETAKLTEAIRDSESDLANARSNNLLTSAEANKEILDRTQKAELDSLENKKKEAIAILQTESDALAKLALANKAERDAVEAEKVTPETSARLTILNEENGALTLSLVAHQKAVEETTGAHNERLAAAANIHAEQTAQANANVLSESITLDREKRLTALQETFDAEAQLLETQKARVGEDNVARAEIENKIAELRRTLALEQNRINEDSVEKLIIGQGKIADGAQRLADKEKELREGVAETSIALSKAELAAEITKFEVITAERQKAFDDAQASAVEFARSETERTAEVNIRNIQRPPSILGRTIFGRIQGSERSNTDERTTSLNKLNDANERHNGLVAQGQKELRELGEITRASNDAIATADSSKTDAIIANQTLIAEQGRARVEQQTAFADEIFAFSLLRIEDGIVKTGKVFENFQASITTNLQNFLVTTLNAIAQGIVSTVVQTVVTGFLTMLAAGTLTFAGIGAAVKAMVLSIKKAIPELLVITAVLAAALFIINKIKGKKKRPETTVSSTGGLEGGAGIFDDTPAQNPQSIAEFARQANSVIQQFNIAVSVSQAFDTSIGSLPADARAAMIGAIPEISSLVKTRILSDFALANVSTGAR